MAAEVAKNEQWEPHVNPWLIAATVAGAGSLLYGSRRKVRSRGSEEGCVRLDRRDGDDRLAR